MRAVILAGGRGSRLAPFTSVIPKPLLPVGDTPILEIIIRQLASAGFDHITLTLGYLSSYFHAFIQQHRSLGRLAQIDFVEEERPTGTAGSLAMVPGLTDSFLVMNGDILTTLDYRALVEHHLTEKSLLTIGRSSRDVKLDLGVIHADAAGRVTDYVEKPTLSYGVSMGIYVYREEVLSFIEPGEYLDFPALVLRLLETGKRVSTYASESRWLDLGRLDDLQRASEEFSRNRADFLPDEEPFPRGEFGSHAATLADRV
jgi:NDP-sugar pyrophosphorylase family protein